MQGQNLPLQNKLKIMAINLNSIQTNNRRRKLISKINQHDPDMIFISETKLKSQFIISLQKYTIIRTDRTSNKLGLSTAIVIGDNIKFEIISHPSSNNNTTTEFTIIKLQDPTK